MAELNSDYGKIDYTFYDDANEYQTFFVDKKGLPEVPITGVNYIFFTSPDLGVTQAKFNSIPNAKYDPSKAFKNNQNVLKLPGGKGESIYNDFMVKSLSGEMGMFIPIFSNRAASLPASSETLDTLDYSETWNKYKIPLGTTTKDSKISGNFELMFRDDSNLTIMKMVKLWYDYIESVFYGRCLSPYAMIGDMQDPFNTIIDYMSSVYAFSCKPDGKTLQYWAKYTGVFPTSNPYEIFASEDGDWSNITRTHIPFQFAYKEDMDVTILRDFNLLGQKNKEVLNQAKTGPYFDDNLVILPPIDNYPGIFKTGNGQYELRINDPYNTFGWKSNFTPSATHSSTSVNKNIKG